MDNKQFLEQFLETMARFGNWDDGCFYYQGKSASELGLLIEKAKRAIKEDRKKKQPCKLYQIPTGDYFKIPGSEVEYQACMSYSLGQRECAERESLRSVHLPRETEVILLPGAKRISPSGSNT